MKKILALGSLLCLNFFPALGQQTAVRSLGLLEAFLFDEPAKWYIKAAQQGNSRGLAQVAQRYLNGEGVPQDYQEFAERISIAAEQGDQWAQLMLGLACFAGRGVSEDRVLAHMWSNVAGVGSDEKIAAMARGQRDAISQNLSIDEITKAQELARNWKPRELAKNDAVEKEHTRWAFWRR